MQTLVSLEWHNTEFLCATGVHLGGGGGDLQKRQSGTQWSLFKCFAQYSSFCSHFFVCAGHLNLTFVCLMPSLLVMNSQCPHKLNLTFGLSHDFSLGMVPGSRGTSAPTLLVMNSQCPHNLNLTFGLSHDFSLGMVPGNHGTSAPTLLVMNSQCPHNLALLVILWPVVTYLIKNDPIPWNRKKSAEIPARLEMNESAG